MTAHLPVRLAVAALLTLSVAACGEDTPGADPTAHGAGASSTQSSPSGPGDSPTTSTTPSPTASASPSSGTGRLVPRGLEQGSPPAIAWAETASGGDARTIHRAGEEGSTRAPADLSAFAPMGSGHVVQTHSHVDEWSTTRWIAADGTPGRLSWETTAGLGVSRQGEVVAFVGPGGAVTVIQSEADEHFSMEPVPGRGWLQPAGVSGEDCKEGRSSDYGCTVYINSGSGRPRAWSTISHGLVFDLPVRAVTAVSDDLRTAVQKVSDTGSCSGLFSTRRRPDWTTCDHLVSGIAPDQEHAIGLPSYADGFGPTQVSVLDMTDGAPVAEWSLGHDLSFVEPVWEDDAHLLSVVFDFRRSEWSVVRLGTDGSAELAAPPVRSNELDPAYLLQSR